MQAYTQSKTVMNNQGPNMPIWMPGDAFQHYYSVSHDSLKRLRKSGALTGQVHYIKTGPHANSKYIYHAEKCLEYLKSHSTCGHNKP